MPQQQSERRLAERDLRETAALDIEIAAIDTRALADEAEVQPLHGTEAELAPCVGVAVLMGFEVMEVFGFDVKIDDAIRQAGLEPRRDAVRRTEHRAEDPRQLVG